VTEPDFRITVELEDPAVPLVTLKGELDVAVAPMVRERLSGLIAGRPEGLILDITDISFMDSSGLNLFIVAFKSLREHEGRLAIVADKALTLRLFEIAGLSSMLNVVATREDARSAIRSAV
jgi:anti-sigma B factor antagonist